jgi:hypothetical protein
MRRVSLSKNTSDTVLAQKKKEEEGVRAVSLVSLKNINSAHRIIIEMEVKGIPPFSLSFSLSRGNTHF